MATDRLVGTGFLSDLVDLGKEIGLSGRQIVRVAQYIRRQETELIQICSEIVAEHPFEPQDNDLDEPQGRT